MLAVIPNLLTVSPFHVGGNMLTKAQKNEVAKLAVYHSFGDMGDTVARGLSALIRACRTSGQKAALLEYADIFNVRANPEFII